MAYSEALATRLRAALATTPDIVEKKMFGGICFMRSGNLVCGVYQGAFLLRVGADDMADALAQPYTRPFEMSGKRTKGFVLVDGDISDTDLAEWVERSLAFVRTLPAK